ncbi:MAG TPA: ATP-binding protein [Xanthobacteraceae bacterium]|nr:ATP-binding protein [Xanthobacteraceae bacterium]
MPLREQPVGSVLSVRGSEATIGVLRRSGAPDEAAKPTVGRFLAITSKASTLIGFVTEVSVEVPDIVRQQGYVGTARLDLMGELKTGAQGARFNRGITDYPLIGDPVVTVSSATLSVIFGARGTQSIVIGTLQQDATLPACVQVDEMLSRHFAVFGTTGVGKSSGIATILRETLKARPNLRIFVLDGHNEYGQCFSEWAQVINPGNLKLPFWLFNFEEIVDVIFGGRPGFEEALEILAEVIPIAKFMYAQYQTAPVRPGLKRPDPKASGFTMDTPVPYRLADLLTLIDERMGKLENRSSRMKYFKLMTRIETISNDPRYNFMFENANVGGDTMADTICQLFRVTPSGKPMTVMQLGGFPAEVVDAVVSVLGRMAFEFGLWSEGAFPLLFVCEEAHRYASADRSLGFGPTRRALSRIAKEGRKCGVFLALVSQRPAELDPTIISQCSTLFVMRMANDRDQDIVRSAVSDAAASLVALVPSLGNREVLAFGEGVALPARMIFGPLPADLVPSSDAVRNTHDGASPPEPRDLVEAIIARWRGASLAKQAFTEEAPPLAATVDNGTFPLRPAATPSVSRSRILKENVVLGGEPAARP